MIELLKDQYGKLFELPLLEEIAEAGVVKRVPAGTVLMDIGEYVRSIPLLIKGAIKIMRLDDDGDELLLYFLEQGDTCAMTMSCCVGQTISEIRAVTELDTVLIMIPVQKMEEWTAKYKTWRNFVFESYHNRLMEMLEAIDSIAFMNMDQRLMKYLEDKASVTHDRVIHNTHQQIAHELHTSRVVISRLLKRLEKEGKIALQRNHIELKTAASSV
jgi:CRP/FNR family transcriptional regulator